METLEPGAMDERTGKPVAAEFGSWLEHPNNPSVQAAE
jgi:dihydropyrimidine dehydrogenase (NAD+) subunit PreA